jgi:hypothetical protein
MDAGGCQHKVTLDQSATPWLFRFPSKDSCGDPVNVPDEIIELTANSVTYTPTGKEIVSGSYFSEPVCWLAAAEGTWSMAFRRTTRRGAMVWSFNLNGNRAEVLYPPGCAAAGSRAVRGDSQYPTRRRTAGTVSLSGEIAVRD